MSADSKQLRTRSFLGCFRTVWRLPWENRHKEVLWRLAVNGVAGAGGHGICHRELCACCTDEPAGSPVTDSTEHRQHAFWDCPVAVAVREQLARGLAGLQPTQWNVWLLQPPPAVRPVVWRVVALAALGAMELGRRVMWAMVKQQELQPHQAVERACVRAGAELWLALHEFVQGGQVPQGRGWEAVGSAHPFIAVRVPGVPRAARLEVVLPP